MQSSIATCAKKNLGEFSVNDPQAFGFGPPSARRAVYLVRELVELEVSPAAFVRCAGKIEAQKLARMLAGFVLDIGARSRPQYVRRKRPGRKSKRASA